MVHTAEQHVETEEAANRILKEYRDFAYTVSHDLNAPLRHVKEFSRLLIGSREENLNEEEREYVTLLEKSLKRLDDMQTGLLAFSRINTTGKDFESVSSQELVENVIRALHDDNTADKPQIEYTNLPTIFGDAGQLYNVFYNILDNATKFHRPSARREVSITTTKDDRNHLFEIKDNGIGIEEAFHSDIFRIFRRLHAGDQYPGSGAGLTLSQKIIERHGGAIWVESEVDKGTSVFFTIPNQDAT